MVLNMFKDKRWMPGGCDGVIILMLAGIVTARRRKFRS